MGWLIHGKEQLRETTKDHALHTPYTRLNEMRLTFKPGTRS